MRNYCPKCQIGADFIDLNTGACEHCLPSLGAAVAEKSRLVSRQSATGATKAAVVQVEMDQERQGRKGAK